MEGNSLGKTGVSGGEADGEKKSVAKNFKSITIMALLAENIKLKAVIKIYSENLCCLKSFQISGEDK